MKLEQSAVAPADQDHEDQRLRHRPDLQIHPLAASGQLTLASLSPQPLVCVYGANARVWARRRGTPAYVKVVGQGLWGGRAGRGEAVVVLGDASVGQKLLHLSPRVGQLTSDGAELI